MWRESIVVFADSFSKSLVFKFEPEVECFVKGEGKLTD